MVNVALDLEVDGWWRNLWLSGPVSRLGNVSPGPSFFKGCDDDLISASSWNPTC
jgi:hypothetical protein